MCGRAGGQEASSSGGSERSGLKVDTTFVLPGMTKSRDSNGMTGALEWRELREGDAEPFTGEWVTEPFSHHGKELQWYVVGITENGWWCRLCEAGKLGVNDIEVGTISTKQHFDEETGLDWPIHPELLDSLADGQATCQTMAEAMSRGVFEIEEHHLSFSSDEAEQWASAGS